MCVSFKCVLVIMAVSVFLIMSVSWRMKFDSKEEICLEIWGAVMVSSECCGN